MITHDFTRLCVAFAVNEDERRELRLARRLVSEANGRPAMMRYANEFEETMVRVAREALRQAPTALRATLSPDLEIGRLVSL